LRAVSARGTVGSLPAGIPYPAGDFWEAPYAHGVSSTPLYRSNNRHRSRFASRQAVVLTLPVPSLISMRTLVGCS